MSAMSASPGQLKSDLQTGGCDFSVGTFRYPHSWQRPGRQVAGLGISSRGTWNTL